MKQEMEIKNKNISTGEEHSASLWFSVSESAKLGGVQTKTIRRAIQANDVKYKIKGNRYFINFASLIKYMQSKTKLKNKFNDYGIGQYVDTWKEKEE